MGATLRAARALAARQPVHPHWLPPTHSVRGALRSIGCWHNESINIWTHLLGASIAVGTVAYLLLDLSPAESLAHGRKGWLAPFGGIPYPFPNAAQPSVTWADAVGFAAFLLSAAVCLGF